MPIEKVKALLGEAAAEINIKAEDEALYWIARESTGSIRDAYTLFDQVAAFSGGEITYDKIRDKLGLVGVDRLNAIFESCAANKPTDALNQLDDFLQSGISIEQLIANSTDYLRSLLLIKNGITKEALLGQSQDRYSRAVLEAWNSVQIESGISIFLQLYRDIRYSLSPRYELELAFSRLSWLSQYVSPAEVKAAIDKAQHLLAGAPAATGTQTHPNAAQTALGGQQTHSAPQAAQPQQPAAQKTNRLPVFSALQNLQQDASGYDYAPDTASPDDASVEQSVPPEVPDPFDEGGAVPPEQTAATPSVHLGAAASANDVRDRLISDLKATDALLASALMRTTNWARNGETITAAADSEFLRKQLESQQAKLSDHLTRLCGQKTMFTVTLHVQQKVDPVQEAAPEVKILCNAFRGNIVSVVKMEETNESL